MLQMPNSSRDHTKWFQEEFQTFRSYLQLPVAATNWHIPICIGESQMSNIAVTQGVQRRFSDTRTSLLVVRAQHKNKDRCLPR